jgi:4-carboxymuconolactone decarboxylase
VPPPGEKPTSSRTGRLGNSCAAAGDAAASSAAPHNPATLTQKGNAMKDALYRKGMKTRRKVLGAGRESEIAREEDDFSMPLREFTTRYVWGECWSNPDLPLKIRSLINVALLTAFRGGKELQTHIRGALNNGCTKVEIREVLRQTGIYAGIPVMREAVRLAQEVFAEDPKPRKSRTS